jgi:predicted metal-dependent enzyme (double-stranded beta helix superfamily)
MYSDVSVAGDPLALPHLLPPVPQHPGTVAEFAGLARAIAADRARWAPVVRYDTASRWYSRLHTGPGYEVWLLSWLPGQGSGPHDHGRSSGVLTVLDGELREHARTARGEARRTLSRGAQRVFAPGYVHEVVNDSLEPAVSLHVYFPGLTEMTPYARTSQAAARPGVSAGRQVRQAPGVAAAT